jgi:SAM-dependent methyltransferase
MSYRIRPDCRLCGSDKLLRLLDLPSTPLANEFPREPGKPQDEFPLYLVGCNDCKHVQLPVVVDPERLFRDYVYVSGTSPVFVEHFRRYAEQSIDAHRLEPNDLVVDIGSNDGTLLQFFQRAGMRVLGVDPAVEIARTATDRGIETWPSFFNGDVIARILVERGPAKLVVANNVFAHADDLESIALGVKQLLAPDGAFVFEVAYLVDMLQKTLFDGCYHEHTSHHAVAPLVGFFARLGMSLVDAQRVDSHGGSIHVTVKPEAHLPMSTRTTVLLGEERALGLLDNPRAAFSGFAATIAERGKQLREAILKVRFDGGRVAAYGAPAKATTLIRTFGIEDLLDFVVDDSPHKQGRWLPGGKLKVVPIGALDKNAPDGWLRDKWPSAVVVLAWNFADSIVRQRLASYRATGGTCIVPLPQLEVIS